MNSRVNERHMRKFFLLMIVVLAPAWVLAQHKTSAPSKPSAPSHSAPSHASTPSHNTSTQHSTSQSHSNTSRPSTNTNRGNTNTNRPTNNANRGNTNTNRPTNNANRGNTNTNRPTNNANRGNTNTNRPTNNANRGNTNTNRPTNNANRGNTNTNRPTNNANRGNIGSHTAPGHNVSLRGGGTANVRPNGQVRSINSHGMAIHNNLHGGRTIVSTHNGARVVTTGHGGYVQRAYVSRGGRTFVSRTYVYHGVVRVGVYRSFGWHGYCCYYGYYHPFFFGVGFYGWAWHPWAAPIAWGWGWGGAPWYGYWGWYWHPYPVYAGPAFWLTDWLIAANLQAAYAAQAEAAADASAAPSGDAGGGDPVASNGGGGGGDSGGAVALSPEVKQAIADEVKAQIQASQQDAQQGASGGQASAAPAPASNDTPPPALDPARRTFIVSADLDVVADGQECSLSQGDVITRLTDTPDSDQKVNVSVASSKKNDCAAGKTVLVAVDDLQEMYNHFAEQLDNGMKEMASKQGTGGMPKSPDASTTASDVPPPAPDKTAATQLSDQDKAADQAEADAKQQTSSTGGGSQ
jgi:hypothetical protein